MKNLLLYDFLYTRGGAEKLSLTLCQHLDEFDLLVSFVNEVSFEELSVRPERLISLNTKVNHPVMQVLRLSHMFSRLDRELKGYENLVFSGSYAPLAVSNSSAEQRKILYCHTPPRFVYDLKKYYMQSLPLYLRPFLQALIAWFKPQYEAAISQMDTVIANSINVQNRILTHLGKPSYVIYPPCDTSSYQWRGQGEYYLSTARLEPYKRVELLVKAFIELPDKKLLVASGGSELARLEKLASGAKNISFTGWLSEQELCDLVGRSIATIYIPKDEDFGMSPVESMAAGKPVIGVNEGGVKESVLQGETGYLVPSEPTVEDVIEAVNYLTPELALNMRNACESRAKCFDTQKFIAEMKSIVMPV